MSNLESVPVRILVMHLQDAGRAPASERSRRLQVTTPLSALVKLAPAELLMSHRAENTTTLTAIGRSVNETGSCFILCPFLIHAHSYILMIHSDYGQSHNHDMPCQLGLKLLVAARQQTCSVCSSTWSAQASHRDTAYSHLDLYSILASALQA